MRLCFPFLAKGSAGCSKANCALQHARDIGDVFKPATQADRDTWKKAEAYAKMFFSESSQNKFYTQVGPRTITLTLNPNIKNPILALISNPPPSPLQHRTEPTCFSVGHFAGSVKYTCAGWLDKNRDSLSSTVRLTLGASSLPLVQALFPPQEEDAQGRGAKLTLGGFFREQLIGLMDGLQVRAHP